MRKLLLYFHTVRYLKIEQIYYRCYYAIRSRYREFVGFRYSNKIIKNSSQELVLQESIPATKGVYAKDFTFNFLNLSYTFKDKIDWNYAGHQKLWTYNLNYFEFLHQNNFSKKEGLYLINDFIANFDRLKDGLEPYPISLRVIHWVKFLTYHSVKEESIDQSLYNQLWQLVDKREFHILGNHLLENGFGLLFGAYYFNDKALYQYAKAILVNELAEQTLADGAHFELSPMYHQLMLYRVLDSYNLVKNNRLFNQELLSLFKEKAKLMLGWIKQITFKNGNIPLLNDSAFNINPTTKELLDYARQLNITPQKRSLKESGYRKYNFPSYEMIVDVGHIGPDYIPGHAHSDIFNFVLYIDKKPFIIDTGTSTYNPTNRRKIERTTAAHNTVQIGNQEQAEIWSSFRVARRTIPEIINETKNSIKASLDYATTKATHIRQFSFEKDCIQIIDEIEPIENGKAYLHFHPDIKVEVKNNLIKTNLGLIKIEQASIIKLVTYQYAPTFNVLKNATKAIIIFEKKIKTTIIIQ